jgi:hypothetical protein
VPYTNTGLNAAVDGIAAAGTWIAFHTADPAGVAGANQTGTRVQTTWAAASAGSRAGSQVSASIGAGVSVTHWSVNSASTAGTMVYSAALGATETFGAAGTLQHTPTIAVTN